MKNENDLKNTVRGVHCQVARKSWRARLITAGLNLVVGIAVALVTLGIGAISLDWVVSNQSAYLQVGLWLLISGTMLCLAYLIIYTIYGE